MNIRLLIMLLLVCFWGCKKRTNSNLFLEEVKKTYAKEIRYNKILLIPSNVCDDCLFKMIDSCNFMKKDTFIVIFGGDEFQFQSKKIVREKLTPFYFEITDNKHLNNKYRISYAQPMLFDYECE